MISGFGLVSSLGIGRAAVLQSLRTGSSGVVAQPSWAEAGLRARVAGEPPGLEAALAAAPIPHRMRMSLAPVASLAALASLEAVAHAGLEPDLLASPRTACLVGCGVGDANAIARGAREIDAGRARRVDPYTVLRAMGSAPTAALVALLGLRGPAYSISSACATSSHSLGHALTLVRHGVADVVLAGGAEVIEVLLAAGFDAMRGALATGHDQDPAGASRPFGAARSGFVLASGAAVLVLESADHARRRGAPIRGRVLGAAAGSDPGDAVLPTPDGLGPARVMAEALADAGLEPSSVDLVLAHATGTVAGDLAEAVALRRVFGPSLPAIAATKGLAGHALGAAGALDAAIALIALTEGFIPPSPGSVPLDPACADLPLVVSATAAPLAVVMANAFGFGGALSSLVLGRGERG